MPMYADFIEVVIRQTDAPFGGDAQDAISFRAFPPDGGIDAEAITEDTRTWAMKNGYGRITFEERRSYTDAGASGAGVTFVLELLGAGATGVALQEIVNYLKTRVGKGEDAWIAESFKAATTQELRDNALSDAERTLDLRRGDLELDDVVREKFEIRLRARSRTTGRPYRITQNADGTVRIRRLD